jgi:hypothetical protein
MSFEADWARATLTISGIATTKASPTHIAIAASTLRLVGGIGGRIM